MSFASKVRRPTFELDLIPARCKHQETISPVASRKKVLEMRFVASNKKVLEMVCEK
jgi:hypothetical protein